MKYSFTVTAIDKACQLSKIEGEVEVDLSVKDFARTPVEVNLPQHNKHFDMLVGKGLVKDSEGNITSVTLPILDMYLFLNALRHHGIVAEDTTLVGVAKGILFYDKKSQARFVDISPPMNVFA